MTAPITITTFAEAWERMVKRGYSYSDANVEKVRMGWDLAMGVLANAAPASQAAGGEAAFYLSSKQLPSLGTAQAKYYISYRMKPEGNFDTPVYFAAPAAAVDWLNGDPNAPGAFGGPPAAAVDADWTYDKNGSGKWERAAAAPEGLTSVDIMRTVMEAQESCPHSTGTTNWAYWIGTRVLALRPATPDAKTAEARKPLTDEQIENLRGEANRGFNIERADYFKAFRDAESAHGIGDQP